MSNDVLPPPLSIAPPRTLDPATYLAELQRRAAEERRRAAQHAAEARGCERAAEAYDDAARALVALLSPAPTGED